jgi:hypothetical protein
MYVLRYRDVINETEKVNLSKPLMAKGRRRSLAFRHNFELVLSA